MTEASNPERLIRRPGLWDDLEVVASYEEFAAEALGEHRSPLIRWSAVVGNYMNVVAVIAMLLGRRRAAAASAVVSFISLTVGHVVEGNLLWSSRALARHPIWAVRADFAVANATIMDSLRSSRRIE
jgi:hypothetical protein